MVNKCANPDCRKALRYLRDGVVYLFSNSSRKDSNLNNDPGAPQFMEHFWLCGTCSSKWILKLDRKNSIQMIEKSSRKKYLPATEANLPLPYARSR